MQQRRSDGAIDSTYPVPRCIPPTAATSASHGSHMLVRRMSLSRYPRAEQGERRERSPPRQPFFHIAETADAFANT
jgi:hypothetical protein